MLFYIWFVIFVLVFAAFSYQLGREHESSKEDVVSAFIVFFLISILWPICLALVVIIGPFYAVFCYGKKRTRIENEKAQLVEILKR